MTSTPTSRDLKPGSIVKFYNTGAGYPKWHICLLPGDEDFSGRFMCINSENPRRNDLELKNDAFPCIPPNETDTSIISCSGLWLLHPSNFESLKFEVVDFITPETASRLKNHIASIAVHSFNDGELRIVRAALRQF